MLFFGQHAELFPAINQLLLCYAMLCYAVSDESNWLIADKRNNGAYQQKETIFLDSHSIVNGPCVPLCNLLHRGGGGGGGRN